jgi:hypothetical protein
VETPRSRGSRGGRPAISPGRLARFYVGFDHNFLHTCLQEKGKAKAADKVIGG